MIRLALGALAAALTIHSLPASSAATSSLDDIAPAATSLASYSTAATTVAGPPWISIEHPVNPYDATTRDAFLLVHAFHHGVPTNFPVSGTAEGMVNGERKTVNLEFTRTSRAGVYAVSKQWPATGEWTLLISVAQGPEDKVTAVVDLASGGSSVVAVRVPTKRQNNYTVPAAVSLSEVDTALRTRARAVVSERR